MDSRTQNYCPNCCQLYCVNVQSSRYKGNLPLFLSCGHSMCENCLKNVVKFMEPIECKICHKDMEVEAFQVALLNQKTLQLYDIFPVNIYMLGELTLDLIKDTELKKQGKGYGHQEYEAYINICNILMGNDNKKDCLECHQKTTKMCQQCSTFLCDSCFMKSHKNFVSLKNHVLQEIGPNLAPINCEIHPDMPMKYYCNDCKKAACVDCFMIGGEKSCKTHNFTSLQDINPTFLEEINTLAPAVDETFRRLSKTAVDIGNLLYNTEQNSGQSTEFTQIILDIEQHFSRLCSIIQKHKREVLDIVAKLRDTEKQSLQNAKEHVAETLKKAKSVMDTIKMTSDPKKLKQINLLQLVNDAKKIIESPWYMNCDDSIVNGEPLKVAVNEDLCAQMNDYIHLEGNAKAAHKLYTTSELGDIDIPPPPPCVVYPPQLPRDVRQKNKERPKPKEEVPMFFKSAPTYRNKSNSVSSLNSLSSDSSLRSYAQREGIPAVQVKPFSESQTQEKLQEGSQELIFISHIIDPHNFYVQRAGHQSLVKDMLRQFTNAACLPRPAVHRVTQGKTYLAYNKADGMWQRSRVTAILRKENDGEPQFKVSFFDFGSTDIVHVEKLRLIPPDQALTPPLAIHCALANCSPIAGAWTVDDAILIQNIIDNKQALMYVREVRQAPSGEAQVVCDVTTFEDGVSIAHALAFNERARINNPRLKYPKTVGIKDRPKIFTSNDDYKQKTIEEVYITHVVSPDKFFVRKHHHQSTYEKLVRELNKEYKFTPNGNVHLPEIGMCVVARTENGPERAVVVGLEGRARVRVLCVDVGDTLLLPAAKLHHLKQRHAALSALASECHLAGVTALNKRWKPASVALMQQYSGRLLELSVQGAPRASIPAVLYDYTDQERVCINHEMIKYKFAVSFGIFNFNFPVEEPVITNKCPLDKRPQIQKKPEVQVLKKTAPVKKSNLEAKDKGPIKLEAKVLQYQSPSLIYFSLIHQQKVFSKLFEKMQTYYAKERPSDKADWKVGDACCNLSALSQTWRRATIVEINGEQAKLFYTDFAVVETAPLASLKELPAEFSSIGEAAVKCHLQGIIPAVGEEWPSITKEFLKELIDSYNRIFITKVGDFKNNSMPVEIWVYHTTQGGALEPNTSEWRCLNKRIIDQGLAIPDKSFQIQKPEESEKVEAPAEEGEEILSFLNVRGRISDWLQLEPVPTKPAPPATRSDTSTPKEEDSQDLNPVVEFISDWLPPEPFTEREFAAIPTYVDNDGVIYLHEESSQETLELIRRALDTRFRPDDPKAKYSKWTVGEPCVALYFLDNRFYRGRVLEVNEEEARCTVHYIDYGNDEQCSFLNMRKSIALHQIPTQAHKCLLGRIRPAAGSWDRTTLDYLHKTIVEKECRVKVLGEAIDDVVPIELTNNKLNINNHLVEFEMATYTDGSKPVVLKYAVTEEKHLNAGNEKPGDVLSDSEPDYIIEDEENDSSDIESMKCTNWNEMLDSDENEDVPDFKTYPTFSDEQFKCNITVINSFNTLELNIVHDEETALVYEEMSKAMQLQAEHMPLLKGVFENKACIAIFDEDQQWYRASILEYSKEKRKVKVKYVDYGNVDILSLDNVREIQDEWALLTPSNITAQLDCISIKPDLDMNVLRQEYIETFLNKPPFYATVIKTNPLRVDLKNDKGELIYQNLIEKGFFIKSDTEC